MVRGFCRWVGLLVAASCLSCAAKTKLTGGWLMTMQTRPKHRVLNVAHRGARSLAPENTLAAARKAFAVGADAWEVDVQPTRDGHLVVMHDDTLARTTNVEEIFADRKPWHVCDFTLDEIRRLDAGSWFGRDDPLGQVKAGEVTPEEIRSYAGERVPTLQEVLRFTREQGRLIDVEIKQMPRRYPDIVEKVVAAIEAEGMAERAVISCFDHTCVARVKSLNPRILAGPISNDRVADPARYVKQIVRGDAWIPSGQVVGAGSLAFAGTNVVAASHSAADLNLEDLRALRKAGVAAFVWTINDEATMRALIEADVTGIVTDFPQRLAALLR